MKAFINEGKIAAIFWPTHGARRLHGSTKLAGEGRLWMMRCAPLTRIVASRSPSS